MLGIQDTRTDGSQPIKLYRCVACAATFPGLSSLLVHQATHANEGNSPDKLQNPTFSSQPSCTSCGTIFASKDLLDQHQCSVLSSRSASIYICECGEEFQDFKNMLEHKRSHDLDMQVQLQHMTNQENTGEMSITDSSQNDQMLMSQFPTFSPSFHSIPVPPDQSPHNLLPRLTSVHSDPEAEIPTSPLPQFSMRPLIKKQLARMPLSQPAGFSVLPTFKPHKELSLHTGIESVVPFPALSNPVTSSGHPQSEPQGLNSQKRTLRKMLVSAFMKRLPAAQVTWRQNNRGGVSSKMGAPTSAASKSSMGPSVGQLRQLLNKSATKAKGAPSATAILKIINSNKPSAQKIRSTVNLTKNFLPIVVLETRHKLVGIGKEGIVGRYQCGRCRRVFQDVDSLTMHHTVHRQEKVRGCQRCKQLLISRGSISTDHLCLLDSTSTLQDPFSVGIVLPISGAWTMNSSSKRPLQRRSFHCNLCKHNYTRLYNLKKHKCQWQSSYQPADGNLNVPKIEEKQTEVKKASMTHRSIGVGPEVPGPVKLEMLGAESMQLATVPLRAPPKSSNIWMRSAKSFMPFLSKECKNVPSQMQETTAWGTPIHNYPTVQPDVVEEGNRDGRVRRNHEQSTVEKGQWTMPIDGSEIDLLIEAEEVDDEKDLVLTQPILRSGSQSQSERHRNNYEIHVSDAGKKRFVCGCGKSYSRRFTLCQHQKICNLGVRVPMQQQIGGALSVNVKAARDGKQIFYCECGRRLAHKEALVLHRKKCQQRICSIARSDSHSEVLPEQCHRTFRKEVVQKRILALPPSEAQANSAGSKTHALGGEWGIMSLPSVLSRKVTCDCGEVFTCPRLLFEHLQMHAQESYICPDCGENFNSWSIYESHLRSHNRFVCTKCNQTFTLQSSLIRHLTLNRCKTGSSVGKKQTCPNCCQEFPTLSSLRFHKQNSTCKPSPKLVRCPVCTRCYGSVEGLQKHLVTHSQANAFRCHFCQRSYPSFQLLKDHRRKAHRFLLAGAEGGGGKV